MNGDVLDTLQYSCDPSVLAEVDDPSSGTFSATGTNEQAEQRRKPLIYRSFGTGCVANTYHFTTPESALSQIDMS
jgi:hypothetical protein